MSVAFGGPPCVGPRLGVMAADCPRRRPDHPSVYPVLPVRRRDVPAGVHPGPTICRPRPLHEPQRRKRGVVSHDEELLAGRHLVDPLPRRHSSFLIHVEQRVPLRVGERRHLVVRAVAPEEYPLPVALRRCLPLARLPSPSCRYRIVCHPERSEGVLAQHGLLCFAQDDMVVLVESRAMRRYDVP